MLKRYSMKGRQPFRNALILQELRTGYLNQARPPASTQVAVAALVDPRLLLEIEAIAVIP